MSARTLGLAALLLTGCGSALRSEPLKGPLALGTPSLQRGEAVFMEKCHQCHPGGEAGLGPALNNKPAPPFLIKTQVRKGLGDMPGFDERKIPDADLDALVDYMLALRGHG